MTKWGERPLTTPKRTSRAIYLPHLRNLPRPVAEQIARPGAALRRLILYVVEPAFLQRQAAAADALVEQFARSFERRNPRVAPRAQDRKSGVWGKRVSVRGDLGGGG